VAKADGHKEVVIVIFKYASDFKLKPQGTGGGEESEGTKNTGGGGFLWWPIRGGIKGRERTSSKKMHKTSRGARKKQEKNDNFYQLTEELGERVAPVGGSGRGTANERGETGTRPVLPTKKINKKPCPGVLQMGGET